MEESSRPLVQKCALKVPRKGGFAGKSVLNMCRGASFELVFGRHAMVLGLGTFWGRRYIHFLNPYPLSEV